ncbi:MAG: hypothetical protein GF401_17965 [Chitinivibrionales bacterium]|nr:hypothetical protein [Chitinivibrionales bacterium]
MGSGFQAPKFKSRGARRVSEYCLTTFNYKGLDFYAIMTNVSRTGAQFQMINVAENADFKTGNSLNITIKTPIGETMVNGEIKWINKVDNLCKWGVEFSPMVTNELDPICYILSMDKYD